MKILATHTINKAKYAIVAADNGGYKVLVEKTSYRDGRRWSLVTPRGMDSKAVYDYGNNGLSLDVAIALFEKKTKTKVERV